MRVDRIILKNFLSYGVADVSPGKNINLITGPNAAGKTNLLDSIYLSAIGRGSRNQKDKDLVKWESTGGAEVTILVQKKYSKHIIQIKIDPEGTKRITIDGIPISRIGELMGVLNIVFFSPNEISLIKDGPSERRRFLDISLCQQSRTYFYTLQRYLKLIEQRNTVIKNYRGKPSLNSLLDVLTSDLVKCGAFIIQERKKFIEELTPYAIEAHQKLTNAKEEFVLSYETEPIHNDISKDLENLIKEAYDKDIELGYSTIGPHRDDLKVMADGIDIRRFGSQGQQRTAVLSLKLAETEIFTTRYSEAPVLLLDDVLSELDPDRKKALFDSIAGKQCVITDTSIPEGIDPKTKIFRIKDRAVTS